MHTSVFWLGFFFCGFAHAANLYDPYEISVERDKNTALYSLGPSPLQAIFYFEKGWRQAIESILRNARARQKKIAIDRSKLTRKAICLKIVTRHHLCQEWMFYGDEETLAEVITVSDQSIDYKIVQVSAPDIAIGNFLPYVVITSDGDSSCFWITNEEQTQFSNIISQGSGSIIINISALRLLNPYRGLIPINEVIRRNDSINN